tara:strand:- start:204 stop:899 length:696 start_codon:yes stop_codon:yes gene_type:complete
MPTINSSLLNNLIEQAKESNLQQRLAAAIVVNNKVLSNSFCNVDRNFCRGHIIPSLHAEQRAILSYYGLKVNYSNYRGWYFYEDDYKAKKLEVAVIRVTRDDKLANARPCRKCMSMMRDLGIKRVHYSTGLDKEIITENIKDMLSINDSNSIRRFERMYFNYPKNDLDYYKFLLKKLVPKEIKNINLIHFIRFNLMELLPYCKFHFETIKNKKYFYITDYKDLNIKIIIIP